MKHYMVREGDEQSERCPEGVLCYDASVGHWVSRGFREVDREAYRAMYRRLARARDRWLKAHRPR